MIRRPTRFDTAKLDERQLKAFDQMYEDPYNYTLNDIEERFGISHASITALARERNLKIRKGGIL